MCMNELNLKNRPKKLEVNSNKKTITHKVTQLQPAVTSLCEVKILSYVHH
jgi:hypothetical protein